MAANALSSPATLSEGRREGPSSEPTPRELVTRDGELKNEAAPRLPLDRDAELGNRVSLRSVQDAGSSRTAEDAGKGCAMRPRCWMPRPAPARGPFACILPSWHCKPLMRHTNHDGPYCRPKQRHGVSAKPPRSYPAKHDERSRKKSVKSGTETHLHTGALGISAVW